MQQLKVLTVLIIFMMTYTAISQDYPTIATPPSSFPEFEIEVPDLETITTGDMPLEQMANYMATAIYQIDSLPDTLFENNGEDLTQSESATQLFSYAKWMFSDLSARELLGETLAPIAINLYVVLTLTIILIIAWATIRVALLIFRFIYFLIREALRVLPFVG